MKRILFSIIMIGTLLMAGCTSNPPAVQASPTPENIIAVSSLTSTLTAAPSNTPREPRYEPTNTPRPPTPLPTIPTFTPTFDVSTIVTVTLAAKAVCPQQDPSVVAKFATPDQHGYYEPHRSPDVLDYLNSGGQWNSDWGQLIDLTGDGLNEVIFGDFAYYVFGCKDGKYEKLLQFAGDSGARLVDTPDLNKNGISEIILYDISHYGSIDIFLFEWDGNKFQSLINMGSYSSTDNTVIDWVSATSPHKIIDTNGDGLKDIVIVYDVHETENWGLGIGEFVTFRRPLRNITTILGWNGQNFVDLKQGSYPPPEYRFQAIQDGDEQVRYGNYTAALSFYQTAIFDDRLEWWSPERREYEIHVQLARFDATPTVYPTPKPNTTEYPQLAAYAYYRIMLLHTAQGHESDAGTVYKTLEQKYSNDQSSQQYYEMAAAFWEIYQSTHSMYDGCAAAIGYATEHPEILIPLGSDYHGGYSHTYVPADICPFR